IAAHAAPYDMPGVVMDGNDVLAVHAATGNAVTRARRGEGPSLLECKTYRWHFHAMRAVRPPETRPAEEIASWKAGDPVARLEQHMAGRAMLSPDELRAIRDQVTSELDEAVALAGGGIALAAHAAQTPYPMWMHLAGLKIVLPSTPADAKGLPKSAIRDNNPVVSVECSRLATLTGPVPDGDHLVPIGVADVKRG